MQRMRKGRTSQEENDSEASGASDEENGIPD